MYLSRVLTSPKVLFSEGFQRVLILSLVVWTLICGHIPEVRNASTGFDVQDTQGLHYKRIIMKEHDQCMPFLSLNLLEISYHCAFFLFKRMTSMDC